MKFDFKVLSVLLIFIASSLFAQVDSRLEMPADSIPPDDMGMRNLTSVELAKEMVIGWNVGNSLEAMPGAILR